MLEWSLEGASVNAKPLSHKTVLITGAARRIGRGLALASAEAGADVIIHYRRSGALAEETRRLVLQRGQQAWTLQADFARAGRGEPTGRRSPGAGASLRHW